MRWVANRYLPGEGFRTSCQNLGNFFRPHLVLVPEGNLRASCVSSVYPQTPSRGRTAGFSGTGRGPYTRRAGADQRGSHRLIDRRRRHMKGAATKEMWCEHLARPGPALGPRQPRGRASLGLLASRFPHKRVQTEIKARGNR